MTDDRTTTFQRARSAEQREIRKQTILDAATQLLDEMPVGEISLRELSRRVGLSKTNVVRYFETREAVFFELLNRSLAQWTEDLADQLPAAGTAASHDAVTAVVAESLAGRPLLCGLLSALGPELERNISAQAARDFKLAHVRLLGELAALLQRRLTGLTAAQARELVSLTVVYTAGLWPFAHPSEAVSEALEDPELAGTKVDFAARLGRTLQVTVAGLLSSA
ncbi:TetR/AcrR family transcriptional regulator [Streptomyces longispororuber]|uniref:TetR/AcrR family transcriptional regulator n=1 Tax=Streptomyces longispororuber TaxID=68230 RepID=UPI00210C8DC9|nr:TetR family transcriptional regulator [Streptomyces longispororuber]MCQ4212816.1 TetR family transcriptional regulator [Streptomyces longispororuber]